MTDATSSGEPPVSSEETSGPATGPGAPASRDPNPDEMAAIAAAYEALWPKPVALVPTQEPPPRWRFSGRWWTKPVPLRRDRP